ncbi:MAG TPA: signal peptidase II [Ruminococcaceae bacterium]|nr:signal peptidase II [Oscillospiraceae bacterium]
MLQLITLIIIAALIAVDQVIKLVVLEHLAPVGSITLIEKFLSLTYVENTGAAFGSFSAHTTLLSVFTALVLIVGLIYLLSGKVNSKIAYACLTVIIAGGISNLLDRIFRGFVVDYIEPLFVNFAVFNFADILVTCGAGVLIIYLIYDMVKGSDGKNRGEENE